MRPRATPVIRKLTILAMLAAAALCTLTALNSTAPNGAARQFPALDTAVLSPRRAPELIAATNRDAAIRSTINSAMAPFGDKWCIDAEQDGRTVTTTRDLQTLMPASTAKLLTASTAIASLGGDTKFETSVESSAPKKGVVDGAIKLVGGGDPLLFTSQYQAGLRSSVDAHTPVEALADAVVAKGVRNITGGIVTDDSMFDNQRAIPSWEPGYVLQGQVGPIGALSINQGIVDNNGRVAVRDPAANAAKVFGDLLRARGVQVATPPPGAGVKVGDDKLASVQSAPLNAIVGQMLAESDNTTAEILLKQIAHKRNAKQPATTAAGDTGIVEHLKGLGLDASHVALADGSGLDRSDRATCSTLRSVLNADGPNGPIANGLPKAGQTGTLKTRMLNTAAVGKVRAKTGTLSDVSALAGWAQPDGGSPISFAVVVNGAEPSRAEASEDAIAQALATLPPTPSGVAYAPDQRPGR